MNFDAGQGVSRPDGVVHLSKIYQGAPYDQTIRLQNADATYVRDFSGVPSMKMHVRLTQDSPVLFELSKANGTIVGTSTGLQIVFPATVTSDLMLPVLNQQNISETRFLYDIEFSSGSVVTERFAQGFGYIVSSTTR